MRTRYLETSSYLSMVLAAGLMMGVSGFAVANPQDGVVAAGSATINSPSANKLDVHQSSQNVVIDWRSFDIAPNEHTQFYQPNSSATALNRANSPNASQILGKLSANGNVIIVNQAGVMFGKDAVVDVNGLVATTSDITNNNFMNGNLVFDKAGNPSGKIINNGTITAKDAGLVGLVAPSVTNSGTITAKVGKVQLASGDKFSVDLYGDGLMNITLSDDATNQLVENSGTITAEGGTVELTAAAGAGVVNSLVNISGEILAPSIASKDGKITISSAGSISHTGTLSVDSNIAGTKAGTITVKGNKIANQGKMTANSTSSGAAGSINIEFNKSYLDNQSSTISAKSSQTGGGTISVIGKTNSSAFVSGQYDVSSMAAKGGKATITADKGTIKLMGAHVTADGKTGGGTINIGGEYQGSGTTVHASKTGINYASYLSANATDTGNGGQVVVWSDDLTQFAGHASAKGGSISGNGGTIELSSKDKLQVVALADTNASATHGLGGSVLLDPANLIIATGGITGGISSFEFVDPNPDTGLFGRASLVLSNGNVVVSDYLDDFGATDAGAVYLFNGNTGALISTLTGTQANDHAGVDGFIQLTNGNFVIVSSDWNNGGITGAGAVTWANGSTGISGTISSANSLVGGSANDWIGYTGITALQNGNYVIASASWDNGAATDAGAITWANGTTGISGVLSAANSLVGVTSDDTVGYIGSGENGIVELTNGNFVVISPWWDNGSVINAGAVTFVNGGTGITGTLSSANSLVGSSNNDQVGSYDYDNHVYALPNGNYVVVSGKWDNGGTSNVGAVTWANGTTGISGVISAANSLIGSSANDRIGGEYDDIIIFSNSNFVFSSPNWRNGGIAYAGAVTWVNGTTGSNGILSGANSLVGTTAYDHVGSYITALTNGNYVVTSPSWDNGSVVDAGAVTWGNGSGGTTGAVSTSNSLYGTSNFDFVGDSGILALANGNYVIGSPYWDNGGITNAGAATWANGTMSSSGTISPSNSLVGGSVNDYVGTSMYNALALNNGNYVLLNIFWDDGAITDAGAVTWGNGATGTSGLVSSANSLVGSTTEDMWSTSVYMVGGSNYVVTSQAWDNGGTTDAGAVTWGNGATGIFGAISAANSLVGGTSGDSAGTQIYVLSDGNYLIYTQGFDNGANTDVGAFTWANSSTGISGVLSTSNSLIGSSSGDTLESAVILSNGGYLIYSSNTDNWADADVGSLTYVGAGGTTGTIDPSNTIYGSVAGVGPSFRFWGEDAANNRYVFSNFDTQQVYSLSLSGGSTISSFDSYSDQSTSTITIDPTFITNVLNNGTAVTLQASNDITVNDAIIANNAGGDGGDLTFQAGRSILINDDIFTDNGDLNIFANEKLATGVVNAQRVAGNAVITMANGTTLDAGTGDVSIRLDDGAGKTNRGAGSITLQTVNGNTITAVNRNTTGDIILESGGALTASAATGDSIVLVSKRNFINNIGASALNIAGSARWLSYSTRDTSDVIGSLSPAFTQFNCTYGGSCGALPAGNGFLYSFDPNAPVVIPPTSGQGLPPTVLYVSQTPPTNIINSPTPPSAAPSQQNPVKAADMANPPDYIATPPDRVVENQSYSLFNGWIIIDQSLVRKLNLLWQRI